MNMTVSAQNFKPKGELRIQCSGGVSDQHYISTRIVVVRRRFDNDYLFSMSPKVSKLHKLVFLWGFLLLIIL